MPRERPAPESCANCGANVPKHARACPECGADERTGWRETSLYDGLDLPETAWQDDTDAASAPRSHRRPHINGVAWYWWAVGVALLALLALSLIVGR